MFFRCDHLGIALPELVSRAGALPDPIFLYGARLCVHVQTSEQAVDDLISFFKELIEEKRKAGLVTGAAATNGATTKASPYVKA